MKLKNWAHKLIRQSEKYTKTDMVYLIKGGFWLTLSQGVSILSGFALLVVFANFLPTETYGLYRYILAIIGILVVGTFPGINTVAIKTVAEKDEGQFWQLLYKKSLFSLVSTLLCALVGIYYLINNNETLALAFVITGIGLPLVYISGMYEAMLYGRQDFKKASQLNIVNKVITTLFIILTALLTDNILILILIYFVPEIITQSIYLTHLYKNRPINSINLIKNAKLTKFGIHLSLMDILKIVSSQIDKMLVFHYLGATSLAVYTIASTPPSQIKSLMQNLTTLALPKMSASKSTDIRRDLPKKLFRLELIILILIIIYWMLAPILFPIFFPKYINAIFISQVYSLSLLFFPRTFLSTAMTAHLKQKELYFIRILAPTIRIIVFLVALPLWGLWGAVGGSILGNTLTAIIYSHFFVKAFPEITPRLS